MPDDLVERYRTALGCLFAGLAVPLTLEEARRLAKDLSEGQLALARIIGSAEVIRIFTDERQRYEHATGRCALCGGRPHSCRGFGPASSYIARAGGAGSPKRSVRFGMTARRPDISAPSSLN